MLIPIELDENGSVLDGAHRLKVCKELGLNPPTITRRGFSEQEKQAHALTLNLTRRHLGPVQRKELHRKLRRLGKSLRAIAEASGVSEATVRRDTAGATNDAGARVIGRDGKSYPATRPAPVLNMPGAITTEEYERELRTARRPKAKSAPPPRGQYSLILADPPWQYAHATNEWAVENKYPTMSLDEICAIKVPAAKDAVLFLWATNPMLEAAIDVMAAWDFEYKTNAVWVKDRNGQGYYLRAQHELLLIGRRGKMHIPDASNRPNSVFHGPRQEHSRKPPEAYQLIERMYPQAKKIELFARNARKGWKAWGNQVAAAK